VPPRVVTGGCCARTQEPMRSSATRGDEDAAQRRWGPLDWNRSWAVNPHVESTGPCARERAQRQQGLGERARLCQLGSANSWVEGAVYAAGKSLPEMSLAFALMAAINGSTGSWATLSHGL
jgi:hypothetical protein